MTFSLFDGLLLSFLSEVLDFFFTPARSVLSMYVSSVNKIEGKYQPSKQGLQNQ
jgi:hypothetical protein